MAFERNFSWGQTAVCAADTLTLRRPNSRAVLLYTAISSCRRNRRLAALKLSDDLDNRSRAGSVETASVTNNTDCSKLKVSNRINGNPNLSTSNTFPKYLFSSSWSDSSQCLPTDSHIMMSTDKIPVWSETKQTPKNKLCGRTVLLLNVLLGRLQFSLICKGSNSR